MGRPARPLHEPGNHHSSERCSPCHSADCGSLIEQPTLLRIPAPTPRPGARSALRRNLGNKKVETDLTCFLESTPITVVLIANRVCKKLGFRQIDLFAN